MVHEHAIGLQARMKRETAMKRHSILRACTLLLAMVFLAAVSVGCGKGDDEQAQSGGAGGGQASITLKYPAALSEESSPWEVAQALIQALEENDTPTLLGLVAAKRETEEFAAIYRKHGLLPPWVRKRSLRRQWRAGAQPILSFSQARQRSQRKRSK